jgi:hypothetical protein
LDLEAESADWQETLFGIQVGEEAQAIALPPFVLSLIEAIPLRFPTAPQLPNIERAIAVASTLPNAR